MFLLVFYYKKNKVRNLYCAPRLAYHQIERVKYEAINKYKEGKDLQRHCERFRHCRPLQMLTEQIIASISKAHPGNYASAKDTGIFLYETRPHAVQRSAYKKSITAPNSLVVTQSHIFALQEGKAVIHVYGKAKGNLETVVPFPEALCSVKLAMQDTLVVLGTAKGRILLWEVRISVALFSNREISWVSIRLI